MTSNNKKILYVTRALIAPPHAGCMIRTVNICRQIEKSGQVTMLAVSQKFDQDSVLFCRKEFEHFHQVQLKPYSKYPSFLGQFLLKWHMHWPWSRGIQASESDQTRFMDLVKNHDIVWFHTMGAAGPFKIQQLSNSVMDLDDLNQCKYEQQSHLQPTLRLRLSAKLQAFKWKKLERSVFERFERIVVCSQQDKAYLKGGDETYIVPNGYTKPEKTPEWTKPDPLRIGFIGLLSYGPNREGLVWFRDTVWPMIRRQKPQMRLRIIGTLPSKKDTVEADGFEYTGYLDDTTEEMKTWSSMVVPITHGGGTRIKILDAFSKLCPIVSTSIGAHGIQATHGKNIMLADDPVQFSQYCLELSAFPEKGKILAEQGWKLFTEKYTWDVIGAAARKIIESFQYA